MQSQENIKSRTELDYAHTNKSMKLLWLCYNLQKYEGVTIKYYRVGWKKVQDNSIIYLKVKTLDQKF